MLTEGRPRIVDAGEPRCAVRRLLATAERPVACHAAVPVRARGKTLGVLSVAAPAPQTFDEAEMALLAAVGQQIGVALENARLWEELRRKEQLRGELLARVIRAQEEERQRIARELHDGIGQSLNALVLGLNAVGTALEQAPGQVPTLVQRLRISASDTVRELQDVIYDLRPSVLDDLGLVRALRWYAQERLESQGIRVTFVAPEPLPRLSAEVETALFRIGQEALSNVCRHAAATEVVVRLRHDEHRLWMEIVDNGRGFAVEEVLRRNGARHAAWGLLGMQERATLFGGRVRIDSAPGQGTRVMVEVPLEEAPYDADSDSDRR